MWSVDLGSYTMFARGPHLDILRSVKGNNEKNEQASPKAARKPSPKAKSKAKKGNDSAAPAPKKRAAKAKAGSNKRRKRN